MLTLASMFIIKEGDVPNMDTDLSIDLFIPLDSVCTSFNLIVSFCSSFYLVRTRHRVSGARQHDPESLLETV